jgi:hypothetical protein
MNAVVISVLAGMLSFLVLHVAIWRWVPGNSPRVMLIGFLALVGMTISAVTDMAVGRGNGLEICAVLWIDVFLAVVYVLFYSALARSVSLTLLSRLLSSGAQSLSVDALVNEYASSPRFEDRIRVMHEIGFAQLSSNSVRLTDKGFRLARWARALGRVMGSGLEG